MIIIVHQFLSVPLSLFRSRTPPTVCMCLTPLRALCIEAEPTNTACDDGDGSNSTDDTYYAAKNKIVQPIITNQQQRQQFEYNFACSEKKKKTRVHGVACTFAAVTRRWFTVYC